MEPVARVTLLGTEELVWGGDALGRRSVLGEEGPSRGAISEITDAFGRSVLGEEVPSRGAISEITRWCFAEMFGRLILSSAFGRF